MDLPHTYSKYWSLDISKYDVSHTVELPHKNFEMVLPRDILGTQLLSGNVCKSKLKLNEKQTAINKK
jgi:hypothetical protein